MVKFILLGHERCGSTVLVDSLSCHKHVQMFGDIFHDVNEKRRNAYREGLESCKFSNFEITEQDYYSGGDAAEFLERYVFFNRSMNFMAVGFKLFYDHCRNDSMAMRAWKYLIDDNDIRVIHLMRLNLLDSLLSLTIARNTNKWFLLKNNKTPRQSDEIESVYISTEACEKYFIEISQGQKTVRERFSQHKILDLTYERNICLNYQSTFKRVCNFLEIHEARTQIYFEKQATGTPAQLISNYSELKKHFSTTKFSKEFQ